MLKPYNFRTKTVDKNGFKEDHLYKLFLRITVRFIIYSQSSEA